MTLEDKYKHETGRTPHIDTCMECGNFDEDYIVWLETRLTLALSRIEAAEALALNCMKCKPTQCAFCPHFSHWKEEIEEMGVVIIYEDGMPTLPHE